MRPFTLFLAAFALLLPEAVLAASYYLDEKGDDQRSGLSATAAWASLEKANSIRLGAGDAILLKGGSRFKGELRIDAENSEKGLTRIAVSSYGEGFATIVAGATNGIHVRNTSDVTIKNLIVEGNISTNQGFGILCENTLSNGMLDGLMIDGVQVSGFGLHGIMITGNNTVFTTAAPAAWIQAQGVEAELRNNILITSRHGLPLRIDDAGDGNKTIVVQNNLYWRSGAPFLVRWNGADSGSLEDFRRSVGREWFNGTALGLFVDPRIVFEEVANRKTPLSMLADLGVLSPGNPSTRTAGMPVHDLQSIGGPLRDFLGTKLIATNDFPLGALAHPRNP